MALSYDSGLSWPAAKALFENATYKFTNDDCVLLADWYTYREIADRRVEQGFKSGDPYNAVLNGVKVKAKALCKSQGLDFEKWKEAFDIRRKRNIQNREGGTKDLPDAASGRFGTFATKSSTKTSPTSNAAPQSLPAVHRHNALATPLVPAAEPSAQDARLATGLHPQLTSQYWNVPPWSRPSNLSTTQPADDVYIGTPYVQHHQNPPKPLGWPKRPVSGVDTSVTRANFPVAGPSLDPYPTIVQSYSARHGCYVERPLIDFPRTESGLYMVGDEDSYNAIYATPGARTEPATVPPSQTASAFAKQAQNFVDLTLSDEEEERSTMQNDTPSPPNRHPQNFRQSNLQSAQNAFTAASPQQERPVWSPNVGQSAMAAPQKKSPIRMTVLGRDGEGVPASSTVRKRVAVKPSSAEIINNAQNSKGFFELSELFDSIKCDLSHVGEPDEMLQKFERDCSDGDMFQSFRSRSGEEQADFVAWAIGRWNAESEVENTTFMTFVWNYLEQYEALKHQMDSELAAKLLEEEQETVNGQMGMEGLENLDEVL
ncbi:unnamed protein product [Zymoseptoria tritici ST99CH_3D7]|uniref:Uncharacterized protein n=1 Tax=Zymoseptoria tritici (strain ST99CH_3D7) TaxID=1276538 RepID=A0A1X7S616_ZYMT9|nr:unnamed protein product [Zymoseptoria tritici ST99CH_3D7]